MDFLKRLLVLAALVAVAGADAPAKPKRKWCNTTVHGFAGDYAYEACGSAAPPGFEDARPAHQCDPRHSPSSVGRRCSRLTRPHATAAQVELPTLRHRLWRDSRSCDPGCCRLLQGGEGDEPLQVLQVPCLLVLRGQGHVVREDDARALAGAGDGDRDGEKVCRSARFSFCSGARVSNAPLVRALVGLTDCTVLVYFAGAAGAVF